jgi:uncharacterized protein YoxC
MWLAIGLACIVVAAALLLVCIQLAKLLARAQGTLDRIDRQLDSAQTPLAKTLDHVGNIAASIDDIAAKADRTVDSAEKVVGAVARAAESAQAAVTPTVANLVGIVAGVSRGAAAFFRSRGRNGSPDPKEDQ